jgi:hypothetical protein
MKILVLLFLLAMLYGCGDSVSAYVEAEHIEFGKEICAVNGGLHSIKSTWCSRHRTCDKGDGYYTNGICNNSVNFFKFFPAKDK